MLLELLRNEHCRAYCLKALGVCFPKPAKVTLKIKMPLIYSPEKKTMKLEAAGKGWTFSLSIILLTF